MTDAFSNTPDGRGETVLVVEDEAELRSLLVLMLGELSYEVLTSSDGISALDVCGKTSRIDLLLTDVLLPGGMSGPELAMVARDRVPGLNVLFMSGFPQELTTRQYQLGKDDLLIKKPFGLVGFAHKLRQAIDAKR